MIITAELSSIHKFEMKAPISKYKTENKEEMDK